MKKLFYLIFIAGAFIQVSAYNKVTGLKKPISRINCEKGQPCPPGQRCQEINGDWRCN